MISVNEMPSRGQITINSVDENGNLHRWVFDDQLLDIDYQQDYESVTSWRYSDPIYLAGSRSLNITLCNPKFTITKKEVKHMSIEHTMSMTVNGNVTTEDIQTFTSQLPPAANWTVKTEKKSYGPDVNVFTAKWAVEPSKMVDEEDAESDYCSCCND